MTPSLTYSEIKLRSKKVVTDISSSAKGKLEVGKTHKCKGDTHKYIEFKKAVSEVICDNIANNSARTKYCCKCNCIVSRYTLRQQHRVKRDKLLCAYCFMIKNEL